jgi:hypothetical protein
MNAILLLCSQCHRIRGCTDPKEKTCDTCTSHDCPLLPAPDRAAGYCVRCGEERARRSAWLRRTDPSTGLTASLS